MESEVMPVQQSYVHWISASLGPKYALLLSLAGLLSFVLALIIIARGKGPMAAAALVMIVPLPMLIGIFGGIEGAMNSYKVIAMSDATVKASEVASAISMSFAAPMVGMLLMAPGYAVAVLGAFARSFSTGSNQTP